MVDSDLLRNDPIYRLYGDEHRPRRLGCGTLYFPRGRAHPHYDVDTYDYSASYVLTGRIRYVDSTGCEHVVVPGDVFLRVPGRLHSSIPDPTQPFCEFFVLLPHHPACGLLEAGLLGDGTILRPGIQASLLSQLKRIRNALVEQREFWERDALVSMQRVILDYQRYDKAQSKAGAQPGVLRAKRMLESDLDQSVSLRELAETVGMGYEAFRKSFKRQLGITPGAYRIRCKMNRAMELLSSSTHTVTEIAGTLGFPDLYSFSKQFKQQVGVAPQQYRKRVS